MQGRKRGAKPKYKFSTEAEAVAMRWVLLPIFLEGISETSVDFPCTNCGSDVMQPHCLLHFLH